MKTRWKIWLLLAGVGALALSLSAQPQGMPGGGGLNASMLKLFGEHKAFSAQAEASVNANGDEMFIPMDFVVLNGKLRMELDLGRMKSKQIPAEAAAMLKGMGMDRMINILLPEKKRMLVIYPALEAFAEMDMPEDTAGTNDKQEVVDVGKETVGGHDCMKRKVITTDAKGKKQEGFTWNASDLKEFPVKMQFAENDSTVTMTYKNINFAAPDSKLFTAPPGYTKHADIQALMKSAVLKTLGK
ncbi:MAG: hypothetical protein HY043_18430 [Verrucomicrobia bacterium]|nr:hypothetical protein [Verrucomicrobiota bacterium]